MTLRMKIWLWLGSPYIATGEVVFNVAYYGFCIGHYFFGVAVTL